MFDPVLFAALMGSTALFSPSSLFSAGEQGAWYDPSDFSTMFQDSAGTTPVTAVEQPVGLILDKSKGLALGAELVPAPYVGAGSGTWAVGTTSVTRNGSSTGQATFTLSTTLSTVKSYRVTFTVSDLSGDTFYVRLSNGTLNQVTANGTYSALLIPGATTGTMTFAPWGGAAGQATITNISVRELAGNHASQATSASRPVLSARVNLLTYSEQFDNAAWTKQNLLAFGSGSIVNATTAPDGTVTADKITPDTSATNHRVEQSTTWAATSYTLVVYAKPAGYNYVRIRSFASAVGAFSQVFNLQNGTVGTAGSGTRTATISAAPNGFYLCTMTFSIASATTGNILIEAQSTDSESGFAGDGTSGIYIWGADLRVTNDGVGIPAYQRVAAATDYDTSGFPLYLSADGTDDSMATSAIDFSATDKMSVFAGVRKLSDAAYGTVAELSASVDTNNGTFALFNPSSPAWQTRLHGNSAATNYAQSTPATYTAPISNIVTLVYDLAGANLNAKLTPRINGVVNQATNIDSGTGAGTGNFGNWPLYIGRRGGTTLPYNGRIYGLVIRGAASTDAQISAMEKWMAAKTGITI